MGGGEGSNPNQQNQSKLMIKGKNVSKLGIYPWKTIPEKNKETLYFFSLEFQLQLELALDWIWLNWSELNMNGIELHGIEIELNWIEIELNWIELKLKLNWNWNWIEIELNERLSD